MDVRGWVYVISNRAMPGLVKIGFSTKDPQLRARELASTGVPHSFTVEYDALVLSPHAVEQQVHQALAAKREDKEWFKCSPDEAIAAIRYITRDRRIAESESPSDPEVGAKDPTFFAEAARVRRKFANASGLWTLSERSLLLTQKSTGRSLPPRDYSYVGNGAIKGFALMDKETPWVRLEDVEFTE